MIPTVNFSNLSQQKIKRTLPTRFANNAEDKIELREALINQIETMQRLARQIKTAQNDGEKRSYLNKLRQEKSSYEADYVRLHGRTVAEDGIDMNKLIYAGDSSTRGGLCWVLATAIQPRLEKAHSLPKTYNYDQVKELIRTDFKQKTSIGPIGIAGLIGAAYLRVQESFIGETIVECVNRFPNGNKAQNRMAADVFRTFLWTLPKGKRLARLSHDQQQQIQDIRTSVEGLLTLKKNHTNR